MTTHHDPRPFSGGPARQDTPRPVPLSPGTPHPPMSRADVRLFAVVVAAFLLGFLVVI